MADARVVLIETPNSSEAGLNTQFSLTTEHQYPVRLVKFPGSSGKSSGGGGAASPGGAAAVSGGPVRLLIHGLRLCLTAGAPPKVLYNWTVPDLRKFGPLDKKFVIEAGARSGKSEYEQQRNLGASDVWVRQGGADKTSKYP